MIPLMESLVENNHDSGRATRNRHHAALWPEVVDDESVRVRKATLDDDDDDDCCQSISDDATLSAVPIHPRRTGSTSGINTTGIQTRGQSSIR